MAGRRGKGEKRACILEAARKLFLRDGFTDTSMDAITREAGVSKATVYAYFPGKESLFATLVRETAEPILGGLPPLQPGRGVEAQLRRYLLAVRGPALTIGQAWLRLGIAEAARHPEVGRLLNRPGLDRVLGALTTFLDAEGCSDPGEAATLLLAVTLEGPMFRALMGETDLGAGLDQAIRAVLRAYPPAVR
jgi:AcrR family transcriptional regulator